MQDQLRQAIVITRVSLHNIQCHVIPGRESRGSSKSTSLELCTQVVQWLEQGLTCAHDIINMKRTHHKPIGFK